jgi:5-aminopentanamidase
MRVAVVQTNPVFGEVRANVRDAVSLMESASADLYILPELCTTGYNFLSADEAASLAEPVDGYASAEFVKFAAGRGCHVVFGLAERGDRIYNSALLVGPGGIVSAYRKVHLFFREKLCFSPGNLGFPVADIPGCRIGLMICFDWIFPESARTLALAGAQIIAHPSNLVTPYCPDAMVTRCLENRVFSVTANRVGRENRGGADLTFIGLSEIVAPNGKILTRRDAMSPGITVADISPGDASEKRFNEFNELFNDRRADQYHPSLRMPKTPENT